MSQQQGGFNPSIFGPHGVGRPHRNIGFPPNQNNFPQNQSFPGNMNQSQGFNHPHQQMGFPPQGPQGNFFPPQGPNFNQQGQQGFYQPQFQQPQPEPESHHEHPLNFEGKIEDKCKICLQNIGDKGGYKCGDCPIILCIDCSQKIFYGNKKKQIHEHELMLKDRNSWHCNLCNKNYMDNASFYCEKCDFDACDKCFIEEAVPQLQIPQPQFQPQFPQPFQPQQEAYSQQQGGYQQYQQNGNYPYQVPEEYQQQYQEQQPESEHEHPLNFENKLNNNCVFCLQLIGEKGGYLCKKCPIFLCLNCSDKIFYGNKNRNIHQHELLLKDRNNWNCNVCKQPKIEKASFFCVQCNFDVCNGCFINENGQVQEYYPSQNNQFQQSIYEQEQDDNYQEPIPESTHEHPLLYEDKINSKCKLCLKKIEGKEAYKCKDCQLVLCFDCSDKIFYGNKKKPIHEHDLHLKERENWKCNICKKLNKSNASFYCTKCDFDVCDDCFIDLNGQEEQESQQLIQQQEPESTHEHPLNYEEKLKETCKLCLKKMDYIPGYKCNECPMVLCFDCSNKVFYSPKNKSIHNHDLKLKNRNTWKCNLCKKKFKDYASFYCKQCDFDSCSNCYLKK